MKRYDSLSSLGRPGPPRRSLTKQVQSLNAADHWEEASSCWECSAPFTLTCRRHHCRLCLRSFCADHAACFVQLVGREDDHPQRICSTCRANRAFLSPLPRKKNRGADGAIDIDTGGAVHDHVGVHVVDTAGENASTARVRFARAPRPPFASPLFVGARQLAPATPRRDACGAGDAARATTPPTPMPSPRLTALESAHLAPIATGGRSPLSPASKDRALVRRRSQRATTTTCTFVCMMPA